MIPDHIIDKAVRAAGENWALNFEWEHDKLHAQAHAALEAVAHIIWNQGWEAGMSFVISLERGIDDDENVSNPYERIEHT